MPERAPVTSWVSELEVGIEARQEASRFPERPLANRNAGLAEATLRLPFAFSESQVTAELTRTLTKLWSLYINATFEVSWEKKASPKHANKQTRRWW